MNKEKYLKQMLICTVIGALMAIILCMLVPDLARGMEMFIYFLLYWIMFSEVAWQVIDLFDYIRGGKE
jgi:uncharacterized membrane protein YwaF